MNKNLGEKMIKDWKAEFEVGATYIDKKTNLRYFIKGANAKKGFLSVALLGEGETFNREYEGYKVQTCYSWSQPYLRKLKLVKTNEPKLVKLGFHAFYEKHNRLPLSNEIVWEKA